MLFPDKLSTASANNGLKGEHFIVRSAFSSQGSPLADSDHTPGNSCSGHQADTAFSQRAGRRQRDAERVPSRVPPLFQAPPGHKPEQRCFVANPILSSRSNRIHPAFIFGMLL